jgi:hypothetical protein
MHSSQLKNFLFIFLMATCTCNQAARAAAAAAAFQVLPTIHWDMSDCHCCHLIRARMQQGQQP